MWLPSVKTRGIAALAGNAADPQVIEAANLPAARCLLVAIPDAFEGGQVVQQARAVNPGLMIIARAHSEAEILHLKKHGASLVIMGEHEIAMAMVEHVAGAATSRVRDKICRAEDVRRSPQRSWRHRTLTLDARPRAPRGRRIERRDRAFRLIDAGADRCDGQMEVRRR